MALSEVLFVVGRYLPAGFLVAFFGAVPLALLARRRGLKVGAVAATAALLLILILGGPSGLFIASPHAISGTLMGTLLRVGRGVAACAVVGIGVRVVLYPIGFLFLYLPGAGREWRRDLCQDDSTSAGSPGSLSGSSRNFLVQRGSHRPLRGIFAPVVGSRRDQSGPDRATLYPPSLAPIPEYRCGSGRKRRPVTSEQPF